MSKLLIFIVTIVLGAIAAEPLHVNALASTNDDVYSESENYELAKTDVTSIIEMLCTLIGIKTSAVTIALTVLEWVASNFFVILLGAAGVLGFCKLTGKCNLNYEEYIPISQIQNLATAENLESAQQLFLTAVEKYAEKRKRDL